MALTAVFFAMWSCSALAPARGLRLLLRSRPLGSSMTGFDRGCAVRDSLSPPTLRPNRGLAGGSAKNLQIREIQASAKVAAKVETASDPRRE